MSDICTNNNHKRKTGLIYHCSFYLCGSFQKTVICLIFIDAYRVVYIKCNSFRDAEKYHFDKLDAWYRQSSCCSKLYLVHLWWLSRATIKIYLSRVFPFQFLRFIFFMAVLRMGRMVSFSPQKFIMAQTNVKAVLSVTFMDAELWLCAHNQRGKENIKLVFIVKYSLCLDEYHQISSFWSSLNNNIVPYLLHQRLLPTGFLHLFSRKGKYRNLWSVWSNQNKKGLKSIFVLIENACLLL